MSTTPPRTNGSDVPDAKQPQTASRPHEEYSILQCDGMLPVPPRIQEAARLKPGAVITVSITDDGILLEWRRPSHNEKTWPQAQKRLAKLQEQAAKEQAARSTEIFYSDEEFLAALEAAAVNDADV